MAWETLAVVTGEITSNVEARWNNLGYQWSFGLRDSVDDKHTGDYAAFLIGRGNGLGTLLADRTWTSLRVGYWFKTRGFFRGSTHLPFAGYLAEDRFNYLPFYVQFDWNQYKLLLRSYDMEAMTGLTEDTWDDPTFLTGNINDWKHISLYVNKDTNLVKVWINGELALSGNPTFGTDIDTIYVAESGGITDVGGYLFVDDLYFDISPISEADDPPPVRRYYNAVPNGAGTYTNWTPDGGSNYDRVNELGEPDDNTTYVGASVDNTVDAYTFGLLINVAPEADAESVVVQAYCRNSPVEFSISKLGFKARLGGSELDTDPKYVHGQQMSTHGSNPTYDDWTVLTGFLDSRPGGGEWTEADFNNTEFGIESGGIV